jgi:hypothetical protein
MRQSADAASRGTGEFGKNQALSLTPALSRWERENRLPVLGTFGNIQMRHVLMKIEEFRAKVGVSLSQRERAGVREKGR